MQTHSSQSLVWLNGEISVPELARVPILDRGFLFGDGVYEAGRSYDRCFLFTEEHWDRLRRSARKLEIELPWSDAELTEGLHAVASAFGKDNVCYRTIVTRGAIESVGIDKFPKVRPTLAHIIWGVPDQLIESQRGQGVRLMTSQIARNPSAAQDPNIKTCNYLNSLLALQDAKRRGGEDAVMCDLKGNVAEGTTFSLFAVDSQERLLTPSLEVGILDSITRRHVLSAARKLIPVEEGFFPLASFQHSPEVFLVSSTREILPVREWDGVKYAIPGATTLKLHEALKTEIREYVANGPRF